MKSRRLTIFCVALVALAGTPRAWQEAGKLLAAVQHKAQVKFWSMVLQPKTRESAATELIASAQPVEISTASVDSNCPLEHGASQGNPSLRNSKAGGKVDSTSFQPQRKAQRQNTGVTTKPLSHAGLMAKALKAPRADEKAESLRHSRNTLMDTQLLLDAESRAALMALDSKAATAPLPPASKGDTYKFVVIPAPDPVASVLVEKENGFRLKLLRKAVEEPKTIRQKNKPPVIRGAAAYLPAL